MELKAKSLALFEKIKKNDGVNATAAMYAEALAQDPAFEGAEVTTRSINGTATALQNKGLICRVEGTMEVEAVNADGEVVLKEETVKFLKLTDLGKETECTLQVEAPKKPKKAQKDAE